MVLSFTAGEAGRVLATWWCQQERCRGARMARAGVTCASQAGRSSGAVIIS